MTEQETADLQSFRADSEALAGLIGQLNNALPDFKGLPCPCDWARLALQKVISDRETLLFALRLFVAQYEGHPDRETRPEMKAARAALAKAKGMQ